MKTFKRNVPEGAVPLVSVEGTAYECGRAYGEIVLEKYSGYMRYLRLVPLWNSKRRFVTALFEQKAPQVLDIYSGMQAAMNGLGCRKSFQGVGRDSMSRRSYVYRPDKVVRPCHLKFNSSDECTSFSIHPALTLDNSPISGQNKDTPHASALKYIVLRMRIRNAPSILVLAYPGEVLGYGLWTTGMTIFRNSLYSGENTRGKLTMFEWGLLALAGKSVEEARELAEKYGIRESGNCLISDIQGNSISVEFNKGGSCFIPPQKGINTHANHPVGKKTAPYEDYPDRIEKDNSRYRMNFLWKLLNAERGRLTAQRALMCLADHSRYPRGICRHMVGKSAGMGTTAAVVAEPARGRLHVVRGNPCCNPAVIYEL